MNIMTNDILTPLGSDWFPRTAEALKAVLTGTSNTDVTLIAFMDRRLQSYYNIEVCSQAVALIQDRSLLYDTTKHFVSLIEFCVRYFFSPPSTYSIIFL